MGECAEKIFGPQPALFCQTEGSDHTAKFALCAGRSGYRVGPASARHLKHWWWPCSACLPVIHAPHQSPHIL